MIVITNDFHHTSYVLRKNPGERVSVERIRLIEGRLCGISECKCSGYDGSRHSKYWIEPQFDERAKLIGGIVTSREEDS